MIHACAKRATRRFRFCPSSQAPAANELNTPGYGFWRGNYTGCAGAGNYYGNRIVFADGPITKGEWKGAFATKKKPPSGDPPLYTPVGIKDITDGTANTLFISETLVPTVPDWGGSIGETIYGNMGGAIFSAYTTPNSSIADQPDGPCPQTQGDTEYFAPCNDAASGNPYVTARSHHPGGVNVSMADGSIRFVTDDISTNAWRAAGTRAWDEVLKLE